MTILAGAMTSGTLRRRRSEVGPPADRAMPGTGVPRDEPRALLSDLRACVLLGAALVAAAAFLSAGLWCEAIRSPLSASP